MNTTTITITGLFLADGWPDPEQLHWSKFHGQPGYAALARAGLALVVRTTAIQAVSITPASMHG